MTSEGAFYNLMGGAQVHTWNNPSSLTQLRKFPFPALQPLFFLSLVDKTESGVRMETAPLLVKKHEHKHPYPPISGVKCDFTLGGRWEGPIQCTCLMRNLWLRPSFTLFPKVLTWMEKLGLFPFSYVVCSNHFLACATGHYHQKAAALHQWGDRGTRHA